MVIDSQGKEVATSGDITPGPRGQVVQAQWGGLIQLFIVNTILINGGNFQVDQPVVPVPLI